jgi:hypothetical protein
VTLRLEGDGRFRLEVEWTDVLVGGPEGPYEPTTIDIFRGVVEGSGEQLILAAVDVERLPETVQEDGERRLPFPGPRTACRVRFPATRRPDGTVALARPEEPSLLPWAVVLDPVATEPFRPPRPS